ncbi:MAG: DUF2974 domain-containing protein [Clostridia bacterium]|nr:DUF2974 domain-containing protein [Clostridia bacterium]
MNAFALKPVDLLIFSMLAYCPMELLPNPSPMQTLAQAAPLLYPGDIPVEGEMNQNRCQLWHVASATSRFAPVMLRAFESHFAPADEKQFAAALFQIDPTTAVVAFRGTDSTVVGWKEDFNMAFEAPVPAQTDAVAFLIGAAMLYPRLYVCGHSKGGNLAVYASAHVPPAIQARLMEVYSFDGPGVDDDTFSSLEYAAISQRIRSYVPESSVVGMLLNYHEDYVVIESDGTGLLQHNPFLWHIEDGRFVPREQLTASGIFTDRTLHDFLAACDKTERQVVVNTIFDIIAVTEARTLKEIPGGILRHFSEVLEAIRNVPEKDRAILGKVAKTLLQAGGSNLGLLLGLEDIGPLDWRDNFSL